jgi:hypothetical protein
MFPISLFFQLCDFRLERVRHTHGIEQTTEVCSLLGSDLSRGSEFGGCAVSESPDSLTPLDDEKVVYEEASTGGVLGGEVGDEISD